MSATFSWETKDLLDRADRAIERSMELRKESAASQRAKINLLSATGARV